MEYKGYQAIVEIDEERKLIFGRVANIKDIVTFQGKTVEEIITEFHNSVDEYLDFCKELGQKPERP